MPRQPMHFKSLRLHFIYPIEVRLEKLLAVWEDKEFKQDQRARPTYVGYLKGYASFLLDRKRITVLRDIAVKIRDLDAKLNTRLMFLRNGGATCVVTVVIDRSRSNSYLSVKDIIHLLSLGDLESNKVIPTGSDIKRLRGLLPNRKPTLSDYYLATRNPAALRLSAKNEYTASALQEILHDRDGQRSPYVMTVATLAKGSPFDYLHHLNIDQSEYSFPALIDERTFSDLAGMLLRTYVPPRDGNEGIDLNYTGFPEAFPHVKAAILSNLYPFPHLYANLHFRSCLVIHSANYQNSKWARFADEYSEILRRIIIAECSQWYLYLLVNSELDALLEECARRLASGLSAGRYSGIEEKELERLLNRIVNLRTRAALAFKDSLSFSYSAGSISHLVRRTTQLFNMDTLEAAIRGKLEALNRMYFDLRELYRLEDIRKMEFGSSPQIRNKKRKIKSR